VTGSPYAQIGSAAKRITTTPVKLITLAPGATATAQLQILGGPELPVCQVRGRRGLLQPTLLTEERGLR
jgi:hypothetical protein